MRQGRAVAAVCFALLLWAGQTAWAAGSGKTAVIPLADGFDYPVGPPDAKNYYKSRGFRPNGHLGDDWNGMGGGNSDLGDPIYSVAHGIVVLARDVRGGWGNCVIVRHAFRKDGRVQMADTLYAHLRRVDVKEGQILRKGDQVGTMGNNRGMYVSHLHFEVRKNISLGMDRSRYARDYSNYWNPTVFIASHRKLKGGGTARVPVDTFARHREFAQPVDEAQLPEIRRRSSRPAKSKSGGDSQKIIIKLDKYKHLLDDL